MSDEADSASVPLMPQPPSYAIAVDLPTYEQAEQSKAEEEERAQQRAREERSVGVRLAVFFFFHQVLSTDPKILN